MRLLDKHVDLISSALDQSHLACNFFSLAHVDIFHAQRPPISECAEF